jgi:Zinc knuckle
VGRTRGSLPVIRPFVKKVHRTEFTQPSYEETFEIQESYWTDGQMVEEESEQETVNAFQANPMTGNCYNCNKPGHFANKCPERNVRKFTKKTGNFKDKTKRLHKGIRLLTVEEREDLLSRLEEEEEDF